MKNTVADLIRELEKIEDKTVKIVLDGCDCYGDWGGEVEKVEQWENKNLLEVRLVRKDK